VVESVEVPVLHEESEHVAPLEALGQEEVGRPVIGEKELLSSFMVYYLTT
jgi:hypothetical protein